MLEIQLFILDKVKSLTIEGSKIVQTRTQIIDILFEVQRYLRILKELERMEYVLHKAYYFGDNDDENYEYYPIARIDPDVEELADILGYDDELEGLTTDDIWERTGH